MSFQSFTQRPKRMLNSARCSALAAQRTARKTMFRGFLMPSLFSNYLNRRSNWALKSI
jgi:hypothetical protein